MFPLRWLRKFAVAGLLLLLPFAAAAQNAGGITVLAAASLTNVMQDIATRYEAATGRKVAFSFAGSMILAKQIEASAGADMFISADTESMDYVDGKNFIARNTRTNLFGNSLVLIAPAGSKTALTIAPGFKLAEALNGGRLAMANTETVPAGRYGKAALTALGVWESVRTRLAEGEDVRGALAYVARGEAPLGIVYATDARIEPKVRVVGSFPTNSYPPIVYPAALTKGGKPEAMAFLTYLKGQEARSVLARAGFTALGK